MPRAIVASALVLLCALWLSGCGSSSTSTGPSPVRPARSIYVDATVSSSGDGSITQPFKTVTAALKSGVANDTIHIAAGTYIIGETFPLLLKPGSILLGAGRDLTYIKGEIVDANVGANDPVTIAHLRLGSFLFERDSATGTVTGTNLIRYCLVDSGIAISHGGKHSFQIDSSEIHGELAFKHGAGSSVNRVFANLLSGGLEFGTGAGATDSVVGNYIRGGFRYLSGSTTAYFAYNEVLYCQFVDKSGLGNQVIEHNNFSFQLGVEPVDDTFGVVLKGGSATFRDNLVSSNYASGIYAASGTPTIIDRNQISVSNGLYGLFTRAGAGEVVGNFVVGGKCGIRDESGAIYLSYDTIAFADTGLYCASGANIRRNSIASCTYVGMFLHDATGAVDSNYVTDNMIGVLIDHGSADLGGGTAGSVGHNWLTGNSNYDLMNGTPNAIKAENNLWDHNNAGAIEAVDIFDDSDNSAFGPVDFEPFL